MGRRESGTGRDRSPPGTTVDAAKLLEPTLGRVSFCRWLHNTLLITDKAAAEVRPTNDVDAIAEITSYVVRDFLRD